MSRISHSHFFMTWFYQIQVPQIWIDLLRLVEQLPTHLLTNIHDLSLIRKFGLSSWRKPSTHLKYRSTAAIRTHSSHSIEPKIQVFIVLHFSTLTVTFSNVTPIKSVALEPIRPKISWALFSYMYFFPFAKPVFSRFHEPCVSSLAVPHLLNCPDNLRLLFD